MRTFLWSVRRELWENRSILIAPLVVAVVLFLSFAVSTIALPAKRRALLDATHQRSAVQQPYDLAAAALVVTGVFVGIFYCLDALHAERRDRSILFWKSLPVSDRVTVFSKIVIPTIVLPAIALVTAFVSQLFMLLLSSVVLLANGLDPAVTLTHVSVATHSVMLLYGLGAFALWHAPIYAWLLLVSAWARRAVAVWALLPWFALGLLHGITGYAKRYEVFLRSRVFGGVVDRAFDLPAHGDAHSLAHLTPLRFLTTPGLWTGLAATAIFLIAAAHLRRNREPV
jgi:ABC-2 type transport system permease protein